MARWWLRTMLSISVAAVPLIAAPALGATPTDPCEADSLNTYQRSECYFDAAQKAQKAMMSSYAAVMSAIQNSEIPSPEEKPLLTRKLEKSQRAWSEFLEARCEFDADLTLGSAGAYVQPKCRLDLTRDRLEYLNAIRRDFRQQPR